MKVHRFSPIEIKLPENSFKDSDNTIELKYKSSYIDTFPLCLDEVYLVETPGFNFRLLNLPGAVSADKETKLLVETKRGAKKLIFESDECGICSRFRSGKSYLRLFKDYL